MTLETIGRLLLHDMSLETILNTYVLPKTDLEKLVER